MLLTWIYNDLYINGVWRVAKNRGDKSGSSTNPYFLGLLTWLNPSILGLTVHQTLVYLGLTHGQTKVCWIWNLVRLTLIWAQHVAEPKYIELENSLDPHSLGLCTWPNSSMLGLQFAKPTFIWARHVVKSKLGLTACQTHVRLGYHLVMVLRFFIE